RREGAAEGDNRPQHHQGRQRDRDRGQRRRPEGHASNQEQRDTRRPETGNGAPRHHSTAGTDNPHKTYAPAVNEIEQPVKTEAVKPAEFIAAEEPNRYHSIAEQPKPYVPSSPRVVPSQTAGVYSIVKPQAESESGNQSKATEATSSESENN
ncbi:MAG TPA: hypothetical protein VGL10_09885, partial [Gammaproteobacteria bacterium]